MTVMLRVKVEKFCSLSTSPSWQAWLFHFDQAIYFRFIKKLAESRGCNQNKDLMTVVLTEIEAVEGGGAKLLDFLTKHYPTMLIDENGNRPQRAEPNVGTDDIFEHYNPAVLTYPRRIILTGRDVKKQVAEFLLDKVKSDSLVVGERAYVEYLTRADAHLVDQVPQKNWKIAAWRAKLTT